MDGGAKAPQSAPGGWGYVTHDLSGVDAWDGDIATCRFDSPATTRRSRDNVAGVRRLVIAPTRGRTDAAVAAAVARTYIAAVARGTAA
jgi:hypothetical protein